MKIYLTNIFLFFIILKSAFSQIFYERYVNLKIGQGVSFGGLGINLEYRYNKVSFMGQLGYQSEQYQYDHVIPASWNFGFDTRYYFSKKNGNWQFFTGLHGGWLSNYYLPEIGENGYNSQVFGLAFQSGIEVREDLLNIEIGLTIDPGKLILNSSKHPYYSLYWYFSPNVGIGVNLYALRTILKTKRKRKLNDGIISKTFISSNNNEHKVSDDTIHRIIINQQAKTLLENCANSIKSIYDRAFYQNDTLYFFKQVASRRYIYIKLFLPNIQKEQFLCFTLNENVKQPLVYLISESISTPSTDELPYFMEEIEKFSVAIKGVFCVYIQPPYCYVNLENIVFKQQNANVVFDRVIICELQY